MKGNKDSTLKFTELSYAVKDSLLSIEKDREIQSFSFKEKIKEQAIRVERLEQELKQKVDKHEHDDLEAKVNRQYATFNERMTKDVDPMKSWIEFHKGWLDGSKLAK